VRCVLSTLKEVDRRWERQEHFWYFCRFKFKTTFPRSASCTAGKGTSLGRVLGYWHVGKRKLPIRVWKGTVFTPTTPLSS
jgi:hypothetical protein